MIRLIALAIGIITLSSCYPKEDYTCVCKAAGQLVEEKPLVHMKDTEAKRKCDDLHDSYQPPAGTQYLVYTECKLEK